MHHPVPRGGAGAHDDGVTCDRCGKVCKSRGGLKLHRRACLTGGVSGLSSAQAPAGGVVSPDRTSLGKGSSRNGSASGLSSARSSTTDVSRTVSAREGRDEGGNSIVGGLRADALECRVVVERLATTRPPATVSDSVAATIVGGNRADALECREAVDPVPASRPPDSEVASAVLQVESDGLLAAGGPPSDASSPEESRAGVRSRPGVLCGSCGRSFGDKRGLSQHERVAHPADYHSRLAIGHRTGSKRRWTYEEKVLVARAEVSLSGTESLNAKLSLAFPERTFDAIKSLRRNPAYRALVHEIRSEGAGGADGSATASAASDPSGGAGASGVTPECSAQGAPGVPASQEEAIRELADACRADSDALCLSPEELGELIALVDSSVRDPSGPSGQRVQALVDKEYDQWVKSLPIPQPKASQSVPEHSGASSCRGRRRRPRGARPTPGSPGVRTLSKRQQRRRLYGIVQELYRKNRTRCAKTVLSGDWAKEKRTTSLEEQDSYWRPLFEEPSKADSRDPRPVSRALFEISQPVTATEYGLVLKSTHESSPGLDRVDRKVLRGIGPRIGVAHMNLWLLACRPPGAFKVGVTVPLPKSADAADPAEFRPITMATMVCRLFHRLLAHRAERHLPLGARQKAFREGDGLADNVWILRSLIEDCKARHRPLCVTFVDVRKAFDTVSHESVVTAAERIGFPPGLVSYIQCLYTGGVTQLRVGRVLGSPIYPARGVRQGDPLSPLLFCAVMHWVLSQLDARLGLQLAGGVRVNHLAFADDVALMSSCPIAMKRLLCELESGMEMVGLRPNAAKSASLRISVSGKVGKWFCHPEPFLSLAGGPVPAIDIQGSYKYLGIRTGAGRKVGEAVTNKLEEGLEQLSKAPLKPEQRLFFLRVHVLPSLYHETALCKYSKGLLKNLDRKSRAAARRWLHLPHDVPQALFHASPDEGGLGLPELLVQVPLMRRARVEKLFQRATEDRDPVLAAVIGMSRELRRERQRWEGGVPCYSRKVTDRTGRGRATAAALHQSCDGCGLSDTREVPAVSRWVTSGTRVASGKSFVDAVHIRAGCLYSKVRASRGRSGAPGAVDLQCEVCPARRETLAHVVQQCPRSAHARDERHNRVAKLLIQKLTASGFQVEAEPAIKTDYGVRRPDVVAYKPGEKAVIIDVTVVADLPGELSDAHDR